MQGMMMQMQQAQMMKTMMQMQSMTAMVPRQQSQSPMDGLAADVGFLPLAHMLPKMLLHYCMGPGALGSQEA